MQHSYDLPSRILFKNNTEHVNCTKNMNIAK